MPKISKRTVDATKPDHSRRVFLWDDVLKGFGLLVLPSGAKTYIYNYRNKFGRSRRMTIGKHGTWTPDQARMRALEICHAVSEGRDPQEEKKLLRNAITVGDLFDRYLDSSSYHAKASSTQSIDRGRIERHLRPLLGSMVLDALTVADVEKAHRSIRDGKTAKNVKSGKKRGRIRVTGGEGAARMSIRLLRAILSWGIRNRLVDDNVAKHVEIGRDGRRTTILSDSNAYVRLFQTLDRMEAEKRIRPQAADAIRLIALTGARRGEVTGLRWRHVDLDTGMLSLSSGEHKTGRITGDDRVIGLPSLAVAIIERQTKRGPDNYVFAASKGHGPIELGRLWRTVRSEAQLPKDIGLHGLRHSLASHMAMEGAAASEIQQILGHRDIATSARYVHWANERHQQLAERAAQGVSAALNDSAKR